MAIIQPHPTIRPIIVARASIGDELLAQAKREAHEINTSKVEGHLKDSYKEGAGMEAGLKAELVCQQELCLKRQEGDGKYNNDLKEINGESQYEVKTKQRLFPLNTIMMAQLHNKVLRLNMQKIIFSVTMYMKIKTQIIKVITNMIILKR